MQEVFPLVDVPIVPPDPFPVAEERPAVDGDRPPGGKGPEGALREDEIAAERLKPARVSGDPGERDVRFAESVLGQRKGPECPPGGVLGEVTRVVRSLEGDDGEEIPAGGISVRPSLYAEVEMERTPREIPTVWNRESRLPRRNPAFTWSS
jgi:hypothetical protein